MPLTPRLSVLFAFLILLAACGRGTPPATEAAPTAPSAAATATSAAPIAIEAGTNRGGGADACVNTTKEVSAAFSVSVTEAVNTTNPGLPGASCIYFTDKAAFKTVFGITQQPWKVAQVVFNSVSADPGSEAVSGLGDAAFWSSGGLFLRKGDTMLMLSPTKLPAAAEQAAVRGIIQGLARLAVDRV